MMIFSCPVTGLLSRPLEITDVTHLRVRILQFLICINQVENFGKIALIGSHSLLPIALLKMNLINEKGLYMCLFASKETVEFLMVIYPFYLTDSFDTDEMNPLESALELLESINQDFNISLPDYKNACISLKELVCVFVLSLRLLYLLSCLSLIFPHSGPPIKATL